MDPLDESTTSSKRGAPQGPAPAPRRRWPVFEALFDRYRPFVRKLLARRRGIVPASVEDLMIAAFATLSRRMSADEPPRNPEAMLVTIVGHELANRSRLKKPDVDPDGDPSAVPCAEPDPEQHAELADRRRAIQAHLDAMDPEEAKLVVYHDLLEMTYVEIAGLEGRPESTVAYQYTRARAHLDERIREAIHSTTS
jgi:RNA polymerase sigma factor (sigma-70 family)